MRPYDGLRDELLGRELDALPRRGLPRAPGAPQGGPLALGMGGLGGAAGGLLGALGGLGGAPRRPGIAAPTPPGTTLEGQPLPMPPPVSAPTWAGPPPGGYGSQLPTLPTRKAPYMPQITPNPEFEAFYEQQRAAGKDFPAAMDAWEARQPSRPSRMVQPTTGLWAGLLGARGRR